MRVELSYIAISNLMLQLLSSYHFCLDSTRGGGAAGRGRGSAAGGGRGSSNAAGSWHDNSNRGRGRGKGNQTQQQHMSNKIPGGIQHPPFNISRDSANSVPVGQMYGGMVSFGQQQPSQQYSARGRKKSRGGNRVAGGNIGISSNIPRYGPEGVGTSYGSYGGGSLSTEGGAWKQSIGTGKGRGGKGKRGRGRDDYGLGGGDRGLLPPPSLPPIEHHHEVGILYVTLTHVIKKLCF